MKQAIDWQSNILIKVDLRLFMDFIFLPMLKNYDPLGTHVGFPSITCNSWK